MTYITLELTVKVRKRTVIFELNLSIVMNQVEISEKENRICLLFNDRTDAFIYFF